MKVRVGTKFKFSDEYLNEALAECLGVVTGKDADFERRHNLWEMLKIERDEFSAKRVFTVSEVVTDPVLLHTHNDIRDFMPLSHFNNGFFIVQ